MAVTNPSLSLSLNLTNQRDLNAFAENIGVLDKVESLARSVGPQKNMAALSEAIARDLEIWAPVVRSIVLTLVNIYQTSKRLGARSEEVLAEIGDIIAANKDGVFSKGASSNWTKHSNELSTLFSKLDGNHPALISFKANHLTFAHEHILTGQEIITDVRPVFDESGENMLEAVVTHDLVIRYRDQSGQNVMHFTMDIDDIEELAKLCERVQRKSSTLSESLGELIPINIIGAEND